MAKKKKKKRESKKKKKKKAIYDPTKISWMAINCPTKKVGWQLMTQ